MHLTNNPTGKQSVRRHRLTDEQRPDWVYDNGRFFIFFR